MQRTVQNQVKGYVTKDGAGVKLVRVLGRDTIEDYDPLLMMDSFDSHNPDDYMAGFPMHPHRGIETITYLAKGAMSHRDSLGNSGMIRNGEVQWMTSGSGIMHEEMPEPAEHLLGVQLWLNMPKKDKMAQPGYQSILESDMPVMDIDGGTLRLISGEYKGLKAFEGKYHKLDFFAIKLKKGSEYRIEVANDKKLMLFTIEGSANIGGTDVTEKTAVKLSDGDYVDVKADKTDLHLLCLAAKPLNEPVAWGGPVVMNTVDELNMAFTELRMGNFIKHKI